MKITSQQLRRIIKEALSALLEGEGKIVCPNCGHHNETGVDKCSKCGHPRNKGSWKAVKEEKLNEAQSFEGYSQEAIAAAKHAVDIVPYAQGALIENEIHSYLENTMGLDPHSDEIFAIADEALSVAGIMLDVGPDTL